MYNNSLYINEMIYYTLVFLLISSYILSFGMNIYFPNNNITNGISDVLDWVTIIIPIYVSLYLIITFNSFTGKKYCDILDINIIYRSGIIILITTALPSIMDIVNSYILPITEFPDTFP